VHVLVTVLGLLTAAVNVFGAWAVSRRRPLVSRLFMLAAAVVTVAAVAYAYSFPGSFWLLLAGAVLTFASSFLNARLVLGVVVWQNHLARAGALAVLLALAWLAL
jgi:hypothetical protein